MGLLEQVGEFIERYHLLSPGKSVVVGLSGGPDSLCLLHVLLRLQERYRLTLHVAHLDHGMRGEESAADAEFVRQVAAAWGVPATIERCDVPAVARRGKLSLEEAARRARYGLLVRVARAIGAREIAVGHNADDQTETVLMHWLRGAGLAGLRGMMPATPLEDLRLGLEDQEVVLEAAHLRLIRPLLETPRAEIEAYCREHNLRPRFDRSNLDTTYFRNRLRHELIPFLESYNPNIREVVRRSARVIADEYAFLRRAMEEAWGHVVIAESAQAIVFKLAEWRALPVNLQRSMLREAIRRLRRPLRNINWVHIENALEVLRAKGTGGSATLPQGLMLRIGYDRFTVADEGYCPVFEEWPVLSVPHLALAVPGTTPLPDSPWRVRVQIVPCEALPAGWEENADPWQAFLDAERAGSGLALRTREPGDRFQPLGLGGHEKSLSEWLINARVPAGLRDRLPLLVSPEHILWVCGGQIDERVKIRPETRRALWIVFARRTDRGEGKF